MFLRYSSPFGHPPPYDAASYLRGYQMYFDTDHFANLLSAKTAPIVPFGTDVGDTAAGAWRKHWKHWSGRGALHI